MFSVILLLILSTFFLIKYNLYKKRLMKYVKHLPSLPQYPLIGSGYLFIGKNTKEIFDIFVEHSQMETPAVSWLGPKLHIMIDKPEDLQTVLLSPNCLDKPYLYRFLPSERGLFTSEVNIWKLNRKLFNPSFNTKTLTSFVPIFNAKSKLLVQNLKLLPDKCVDVSKYIFACTLDMICATSLGYDSAIQSDKNKEFLESMESLFRIVANRMVKMWLHPSWIYKMTVAHQIEKRLIERISSLTTMIKVEKQKEYEDKIENSTAVKTTTETPEEFSTPQTFIDELLKLSKTRKVSNNEIADHVITILIGGNETSALVASHTILMLAMHPKHQEKVFAELCNVCKDSEITLDIMLQLPYMDMVVKEVMRLFPIGPLIGRVCWADTEISNCTIPRGATVVLLIHRLHRNPKYWGEHADDFDPENFSPERIAARHPYAYLPFSGGARNCIGMKYAWMSLRILLAHLLLNFKFSTGLKMEELTFRWDVTMKIENKQMITVEKRI